MPPEIATNPEPLTPGIAFVDHTADWALRVRAPDMETLFSMAAVGLAQLLVGDPDDVDRAEHRSVMLDAPDIESLLVAWLGELAYWAETERLVVLDATFATLTDQRLEGTVRGGPAAELHNHVKAVTYHDLAIVPVPGGLETTVVFDV